MISENVSDSDRMVRALDLAEGVAGATSPNPWVGVVVVGADGNVLEGVTEPPGGRHAEVVALDALEQAGGNARGSTLYTTLEPCCHYGRTPPCTERIIESGVKRVVIALMDPDPQVNGAGVEQLRSAGVEVVTGVHEIRAREQLGPYLKHRSTGLPWVILKLGSTLDGRIAAPDGTSKWITGAEAREDVQKLRTHCDAIITGAGTVRVDDPELTVRTEPAPIRQPLRVVLGRTPNDARVLPAREFQGNVGDLLAELGRDGCIQVLVEGGATVAHEFHTAGLVDRYILYVAPAFFGGDDGVPIFRGAGSPSVESLWRGRLVSVARLGDDIRIDIEPQEAAKWRSRV
ncbi:MAG: bifunctional diaminohydroxyphosphoribosylaminopyrimidine deaminase/5-amino-6-(5-phosphoribosylamino)uracil reductase RibD [Acidimicrobiales bacterium]